MKETGEMGVKGGGLREMEREGDGEKESMINIEGRE